MVFLKIPSDLEPSNKVPSQPTLTPAHTSKTTGRFSLFPLQRNGEKCWAMQGHYLLGSYAMEEYADPHPAPQTAWRVMIGLVASDEGRFWLKKKVEDFFKKWGKVGEMS